MTPIAAAFMQELYQQNVYEGFDYSDIAPDVHGSGGNPVFEQIFDAAKPGLVIEVGSWKGSSAIRMAQLMKERDIPGVVLCVDTWLGGLDHISKPMAPEWDISRYRHHGYPTLYYQFMANVLQAGMQDYIVPFPNTSAIAARWLQQRGIQADLIYVDASHEENDVYNDINDYWKVLRPGGVMLGDDYNPYWAGLVKDVGRFSEEHGLTIHSGGQNNWMFIKPGQAAPQ